MRGKENGMCKKFKNKDTLRSYPFGDDIDRGLAEFTKKAGISLWFLALYLPLSLGLSFLSKFGGTGLRIVVLIIIVCYAMWQTRGLSAFRKAIERKVYSLPDKDYIDFYRMKLLRCSFTYVGVSFLYFLVLTLGTVLCLLG